MQQLIRITDDSALGKALFLKSYLEAPRVAMKPQTIRAGWKSAGMWPVSMAQTLRNPWFLERQRQRESNRFNTPSAKKTLPFVTETMIYTPYHGLEVRSTVEPFKKKKEVASVARLLFRKVNKAVERHLAVIDDQQQEIDLLKAQVDHFRPKRRKEVKLGNNPRFANIVTIRNTREQVRKLGKKYMHDVEVSKNAL
ncbi:hypothetical protein QL093DRAFT_2118424 [Fusarium oxysporum]|nr:hypothetical protein QL093DRAFT_2118424 [Fusarium oxysporum]